jgi:rhamnosyltransferase
VGGRPPGPGPASVCAVVVTFQPDRDVLLDLMKSVGPQVQAVVVVDNDSDPNLIQGVEQFANVLAQRSNVGLATAQNIGIDWARDQGHSHVLLLDQDSVPDEGMVAALVRVSSELAGENRNVAAVGPTFHDLREPREAPFERIGFPLSRKIRCEGQRSVRCDFLIASGALIPIAVLDDVGGMDDDLFVDNVDLEWSFRARARGYELHGVCSATMGHRLGGDRKAILFGARVNVIHPPMRLYYIMRNRTLLYRMRATPRTWIAQDVLRVPLKFLIFAALIEPRRRNASMMLRGLRDGLLGRRGPVVMGSNPDV